MKLTKTVLIRMAASCLACALLFGMGVPAARAAAEPGAMLAAGGQHSVYLHTDGTAAAVGSHADTRCDVDGWENVVQIAARNVTVGVTEDYEVLTAGTGAGVKEASAWKNITSVAVGENNILGIRRYGGVAVAGDDTYGQKKAQNWYNVVQAAAAEKTVFGLRKDGTVVAAGSDAFGLKEAADWTGITAISAGTSHVVGLLQDGTAVALGENGCGQCDVSGWTDLVAVSAGGSHTVGLKADGTVVAAGQNADGQCEVFDWTDVVQISAGGNHTLALRADGTVLSTGSDAKGQCGLADAIPAELAYGVGKTVEFGSYDGKPLEWVVMSRSGGKAVLVTKSILANMDYSAPDGSGERPGWKDSSLRGWLNGEFLEGFTAAEKRAMQTMKITEPKNAGFRVETVSDRAAIPGRDDVQNWFEEDAERIVDDTPWLLRTYSSDLKTIWYVSASGKIVEKDSFAAFGNAGVRPMICVEYRK